MDVSHKEAMGAARHASVSASLPYMQRDIKSEAARFMVLNNRPIP